jgi:hypothetical protein
LERRHELMELARAINDLSEPMERSARFAVHDLRRNRRNRDPLSGRTRDALDALRDPDKEYGRASW